MSLPWYRIGPQPGGSGSNGIYGAPLTPTPAFWIAYRASLHGREDLAYNYAPDTMVFTTVNDSAVTLSVADDLVTITVNETESLRLESDVLTVEDVGEFAAPHEPCAVFYMRRRQQAIPLAILTESGRLSVGRVLEDSTFSVDTARFRFRNGGVVRAAIGPNGLQAHSLQEGFA